LSTVLTASRCSGARRTVGVVASIAIVGGGIEWTPWLGRAAAGQRAVRAIPDAELTIGAVSTILFTMVGLVEYRAGFCFP
jgi:hypothetical protein